ncbi:hypothetical protein VPH35_113778 [Triticum aestivum]
MDVDGDGDGLCFPYDVLLQILRQLPCGALLESRRLLFPHFFPRGSFPGIFTNSYGCDARSCFFAPSEPCSGPPQGTHDGPVFRRPLFQHDEFSVLHYCNGLLLLEHDFHYYVCNPATVRGAELLVPSEEDRWWYRKFMFLAFDPVVSAHYEVFLLPQGAQENNQPHKEVKDVKPQTWMEYVQGPHSSKLLEEEQLSEKDQDEFDTLAEQQEMHALPRAAEQDKVISILVFSSQTNQWSSREFVPGRCAPGALYDMVTAPHHRRVRIWKSAEYWRGSLYVHCCNNIIMILRNSNGVYDMAQLPGKAYDDDKHLGLYELLDRSILVNYDKGVHYVALDKFQLHVWTLTESADGQIGWMLAHETDLVPYNHELQQLMEPRVPWEVVESNKGLLSLFEHCNFIKKFIHDEEDYQSDTIDESYSGAEDDEEGIHEVDELDGTIDDCDGDSHDEDAHVDEDEEGEIRSEDDFEYSWDSDEDNFIDPRESDEHLGDKEYGTYKIIGLHPHKDVVFFKTYGGAVAYHLRTSRMQYLGWRLNRSPHQNAYGIDAAFPYRPCYFDALPANKLPSSLHAPYHG